MPASEAGGIRLPNAPLHDIASLGSQPNSPRKAATSPYYNTNGRPISPAGGDYFGRRSSLPVDHQQRAPVGLPETTGWQTVPMPEMEGKRSRSSSTKPMDS